MPTQISKPVSEQILDMVSKQVDIPLTGITLDSNFETDLGFDSLELVEFTMAVEEQFHISVPDETATAVKTVRQAIDMVEEAIARQVGQT